MLTLLIFVGEAVRDAFDPRHACPGAGLMALLSVRDLSVAFVGREVVRGVSFDVQPGRDPGARWAKAAAGKSVTALSCLRLLSSAGSNPAGSITLDGVFPCWRRMTGNSRDLRGGVAGMVFQEPTDLAQSPAHD
jgi:microcin C transport system ATP-binding protein